MSDSSERGRSYERKIQGITRRLLPLDSKRDSRSGAGIYKADIRDRYNELPLFIECKDHETLKPKEWFRDADAKSSYGQAPIVVFPMESEDLCIMRYTDLLQLVKEMFDWKDTVDDLREPAPAPAVAPAPTPTTKSDIDIESAVKKKAAQPDVRVDRNGHITDQWGYCQQKGCKYNRTYRAPKKKRR